MNLPVAEIFTSLQGEGMYTGVPSHFIRLSGCNLRCVFNNSICDTPYASFDPEKQSMSVEEILSKIANSNVRHVVITGGEPLLYKGKGLEELTKALVDKAYFITVETNGSIKPSKELLENIALWSVSPKLKNSEPDCNTKGITEVIAAYHKEHRINIDALSTITQESFQYQLKFVSDGNSSDIEEIESILNQLVDTKPSHIFLMPEGHSEEILSHNRKKVAEICIQKLWNYCERVQIIIWGDKRGF